MRPEIDDEQSILVFQPPTAGCPGDTILSTLFWICAGIVIGWNLPQPPWARMWQDKVIAAIKSVRK
jgi:hypothetical protein